MDNNIGEEYASLALRRFFDTTTNNIEVSALVNRALADKISTETINKKVNNQLNSIYAQMSRINPKFNESSKNYKTIKQDILDVLTDYELALTELSDYYDVQLEELILKKVELEANLVGKVFREENLKKLENNKIKFKDNDTLKSGFAEKTQNILDQMAANRQSNNSIDLTNIRRLQDLSELENEQTSQYIHKDGAVSDLYHAGGSRSAGRCLSADQSAD